MATRIVVPDAGQTTDELLLVKWHVAVGDEVAVGDFLADIETDKAVAELESYVAGRVLKLLAEEGDTVTTGQALLWVGELGEEVPEAGEDGTLAAAAEGHRQRGTVPRSGQRRAGSGTVTNGPPHSVLATPAARTAARADEVELAGVAGTGLDGCIVKRDVLAAGAHGTAVPLSPMRRAIASRLQQSVREAPQFHVAMDVDMGRALALRQSLPAAVTVNDLIVKACADTLAEFPGVNARWEGNTVRYLTEVNVGIAVSVEEGLVVPVLAGADRLTLAETASRSRALIESARAGKLAAGAQSSFTVSNLGMYGVKWFTAIINPPEAAILAVGAIGDRLVVTDSNVVAVPTLTLVLSADHRLIDGQLAARFLKALKDRLESPDALGA